MSILCWLGIHRYEPAFLYSAEHGRLELCRGHGCSERRWRHDR